MRRAILAVVLVLAVAGCGGGGGGDPSATTKDAASGPPLRIGTKNFPEEFLLGELYSQALRANGFKVELKRDVGSTEIIHEALTGGALDMYPEYVGVLLSEVANQPAQGAGPAEAYARAKMFEERRGFTLLAMTPFSDSNALAVTPGFARRRNVHSIADLRDLPGRVRIGAPPEFATRFEGLVGLRQVYGVRNARATPLTIGAQYKALDRGRVDAAAVFTTDGQLAEGRYVLLEDPRKVFGTQHVAPVISRRALRSHGPRLRAVIDAVSRRLSASAMRRMNAQVQLRGREPRVVAAEFLKSSGLT